MQKYVAVIRSAAALQRYLPVANDRYLEDQCVTSHLALVTIAYAAIPVAIQDLPPPKRA